VRLVVLGTDGDDLSRIVRVKDVLAHEEPEPTKVLRQGLWSTREFPPDLPVPRRLQSEASTGFKGDERTSGFLVVRFPPNRRTPLHRTDTLDYEVIVAGRIALHADRGSVDLEAGDLVVIPGLRHFWATGDEECTVAVSWLSLGMTPPGPLPQTN
jgi:quercetin dioxygenase-like cupin family protein